MNNRDLAKKLSEKLRIPKNEAEEFLEDTAPLILQLLELEGITIRNSGEFITINYLN